MMGQTTLYRVATKPRPTDWHAPPNCPNFRPVCGTPKQRPFSTRTEMQKLPTRSAEHCFATRMLNQKKLAPLVLCPAKKLMVV